MTLPSSSKDRYENLSQAMRDLIKEYFSLNCDMEYNNVRKFVFEELDECRCLYAERTYQKTFNRVLGEVQDACVASFRMNMDLEHNNYNNENDLVNCNIAEINMHLQSILM